MKASFSKAQMTRSKKRASISDTQLHAITEVLEMFDNDGSGMIDNKEMKIAMRALGFEPKRGEIKQFLR